MSLLTKKEMEIGCGGFDNSARSGSYQLQASSGASHIKCTLIQGAGQSTNTPAYVLIEDYDAIPANTKFNFFLSKIATPVLLTYAHLLIRV